MNLNPEFLKYNREIIFENKLRQCIKITWPPGHFSLAHDHGASKGFFLVLKGSIFQIAFNPELGAGGGYSEKTIFQEGMIAYEYPNIIHVVGNNSIAESAITLHYYSPELQMTYYHEMMKEFCIIMMKEGQEAGPECYMV